MVFIGPRYISGMEVQKPFLGLKSAIGDFWRLRNQFFWCTFLVRKIFAGLYADARIFFLLHSGQLDFNFTEFYLGLTTWHHLYLPVIKLITILMSLSPTIRLVLEVFFLLLLLPLWSSILFEKEEERKPLENQGASPLANRGRPNLVTRYQSVR